MLKPLKPELADTLDWAHSRLLKDKDTNDGQQPETPATQATAPNPVKSNKGPEA